MPGGHEQDDTGEPGHGSDRRGQPRGQEEQGDPADDRDGGPRQLEQSVPAREEVVGHRARLQAGGAGHDDRGRGRNEEEGRERLDGGARHRSTTDHDAVEDRNPECQKDAEIGEPAADDAQRVRVGMDHAAGSTGQIAGHVADAEVEEPLGGMAIGRRQRAPRDEVDAAVLEWRPGHDQGIGIIRVDGARAGEEHVAVEIRDVGRAELGLERLAEDEADLLGRLRHDGPRAR